MRGFTPALVAVLLFACFPLLSAPSIAQTCTCAGSEPGVTILSDEAPPPLPDYDQPPLPGPGYIWTPGYWAWNNYDYYWVPGTWVEPPQPGLLWTPGYWALADGVYAFHRGYWGQRIGFYGGVDYGFGYRGHGYDGGYWDGDRFFYNRAVNRIGLAHIENVYDRPAPAAPNAGRASFSGPGGATMRPTAEEQEFAHERHMPPTRGQIDHARTASMTSGLFSSENHGKPAIAATTRPTVFTGPGIVGAREGGVAPALRVNQPPGGEPGRQGERPARGEPPRGGPTIPEPQLPPAVEGPAHALPPGIEQQRRQETRPAELERRTPPNPGQQPAPGAAGQAPGAKLPPGIERQRQNAAPPVANQPPTAPNPGTGPAANPRLPPGLERQRQNAAPVANEPRIAPNPAPQRLPAGGPTANPQLSPGNERQRNESDRRPAPPPGPQTEMRRPGPLPGQPGRPPAPQHQPGTPHACGQPGQPKCP
ncbi:MAG TPA: hypothetical protein VGH40_15750 [Roseiarcus sp.]|jgi:hypothetical protein